MDNLTTYLAIWATAVSTSLGFIRLWELFTSQRIRLDTSYVFRGHDELDDEIIIANLSNFPVIVSRWTLNWKPRFSNRAVKEIDATPDFQDELSHFKIEGQSYYKMVFSHQDKIPWGDRVSAGRKLVLELHCYGRRRPIRLRISGKT